ncbi:MAG: (2Fe-2S) ferredoxin domain-containing protein [Candidatus Peribacteria bacterium]|nr:MAG: (2Fe-2S) ferredoxin domain-containing protein [Candidatus Peribacteria bacterium]
MKVQVCTGKTCKERFSQYILTRLQNDKELYDMHSVDVCECPCTGNCKIGPSVIIDGNVETHMNPAKASEMIREKRKQ